MPLSAYQKNRLIYNSIGLVVLPSVHFFLIDYHQEYINDLLVTFAPSLLEYSPWATRLYRLSVIILLFNVLTSLRFFIKEIFFSKSSDERSHQKIKEDQTLLSSSPTIGWKIKRTPVPQFQTINVDRGSSGSGASPFSSLSHPTSTRGDKITNASLVSPFSKQETLSSSLLNENISSPFSLSPSKSYTQEQPLSTEGKTTGSVYPTSLSNVPKSAYPTFYDGIQISPQKPSSTSGISAVPRTPLSPSWSPRMRMSSYSPSSVPSTPTSPLMNYRVASPLPQLSTTSFEMILSNSRDMEKDGISWRYLSHEKILQKYAVNDIILEKMIIKLKDWIINRLLVPLIQEIIICDKGIHDAGLDEYSCLNPIIYDGLRMEDGSLLNALQSLKQRFISRGLTDWDWKRRLEIEKALSAPSYKFKRPTLLQRIESLSKNPPMMSSYRDNIYEYDTEATMKNYSSNRPFIDQDQDSSKRTDFIYDSDILMHLLSNFMDAKLPPSETSFQMLNEKLDNNAADLLKEGPFSKYIYIPFESYDRPPFVGRGFNMTQDKKKLNYSSRLAMSPYPIIIQQIRRFPPRYHLISKFDSTIFCPEDGRNHFFYTIIFLLLHIKHEYAGYLGMLNLGSKNVDLLSVMKVD